MHKQHHIVPLAPIHCGYPLPCNRIEVYAILVCAFGIHFQLMRHQHVLALFEETTGPHNYKLLGADVPFDTVHMSSVEFAKVVSIEEVHDGDACSASVEQLWVHDLHKDEAVIEDYAYITHVKQIDHAMKRHQSETGVHCPLISNK